MTHIVKIGDISSQIRGVSYSKNDAVLKKEEGYLPILRANNIQEQGLILDNLVYVPEHKISQKQRILSGDVIIAASSGSIDVVGKAASAKEDINAGFGAFCKILRPNTKLVDPRYFANYFQTKKYRQIISSLAAGANINNLRNEHLDDLEILLPPLSEQRRIASILDKADELRQKRQQAIEKLDQLLQAEFMSKFHQKNYPEFNVSDLLENEKSMRTGPFGSQLLHSEFVDEGIHVLGIDNAVQNSFNWAKPRFITEEKYKFLKRYTVKPKDVIITIMGTCGKCAVVPDDIPIAINTKHLCCITLDQTKCNPEFLHSYFLLHPTARNYLESRAKGAIMSGLNMGIIKELPVELPPIKIQNEFSILKQKIILQKTLMIKELSKLNELFTSLQIQAFSGTL
ncbi:restriction endonuclease subunit S [Acinetobacter baumannii]|uniref:restriction endonuclease subunit S n=1 Tax=Acinetobacter baumannii TaxID=470 RepID=UPI00044FB564|nr:restriction endonuclease subunit S [Acinetobacter baumannii]EXH88041.1 type I restriction modification DNA specificity domain protein [Acinetobacter baumannii 318814]MDC4275562.1 restriction endonuclease subunit S [Acinetobacter baumannii]MDC5299081.1 restriction endonuclease subunit S [Acinetobacter baumannii]MDC5411934.1 restriction endonuclease subunit S [Acinetobacter baumannii]MDC5437750.1 restriction endonuclease subunit S [Acinetobacter baumannii]